MLLHSLRLINYSKNWAEHQIPEVSEITTMSGVTDVFGNAGPRAPKYISGGHYYLQALPPRRCVRKFCVKSGSCASLRRSRISFR